MRESFAQRNAEAASRSIDSRESADEHERSHAVGCRAGAGQGPTRSRQHRRAGSRCPADGAGPDLGPASSGVQLMVGASRQRLAAPPRGSAAGPIVVGRIRAGAGGAALVIDIRTADLDRRYRFSIESGRPGDERARLSHESLEAVRPLERGSAEPDRAAAAGAPGSRCRPRTVVHGARHGA